MEKHSNMFVILDLEVIVWVHRNPIRTVRSWEFWMDKYIIGIAANFQVMLVSWMSNWVITVRNINIKYNFVCPNEVFIQSAMHPGDQSWENSTGRSCIIFNEEPFIHSTAGMSQDRGFHRMLESLYPNKKN
ncbi:hypothetical protein ACJX0J_011502, partial [Zea mays]